MLIRWSVMDAKQIRIKRKKVRVFENSNLYYSL